VKLELELESSEIGVFIFLVGFGLLKAKEDYDFVKEDEGVLVHNKVLEAVKKLEDSNKTAKDRIYTHEYHTSRDKKKREKILSRARVA
jgi:hypothetical protein